MNFGIAVSDFSDIISACPFHTAFHDTGGKFLIFTHLTNQPGKAFMVSAREKEPGSAHGFAKPFYIAGYEWFA